MSTRKQFREHFEKIATPVLKEMVEKRQIGRASAKVTLECVRAALHVGGMTDSMMRADVRRFARAHHRWVIGGFKGEMILPWPMVA